MNRFPQTKTTYGFTVWFITCVTIGLGLAYLEGIGAKVIITTAVLIASGVCIALLGAWIPLAIAYRVRSQPGGHAP